MPFNKCGIGFLLFLGETSLSPVLASVCGRDSPGSLHSTGDSMFIHFSSDSRIGGRGFNASYSRGKFINTIYFKISKYKYKNTNVCDGILGKLGEGEWFGSLMIYLVA